MTTMMELDIRYIQELRKNKVSIEGMEESVEGFFDTLSSVIPNTIKAFFGFSNSFDVKDYGIVKPIDSKISKKIGKDLLKYGYLDLSEDSIAYVPPYYTGTYLQYIDLLLDMAEYNSHLLERMNTFAVSVGEIISSETGQMKDFSKDISNYSKWAAERNTLKNTLASLYTGKNANDAVRYGNVIKRQADWTEINEKLAELTKRINSIDAKEVKKKVDTLSNHLMLLKENIEKGVIKNPNKDFNKSIAQGALEIAEEVEFYALLRYQYDIIITCITRTVEQIR